MTTATSQEAAQEGQVALASLVREHQADLWRYLRFLGCEPADADDLVQETFLAVARRPFEVRSTRETAAYLRTAARRQMLSQLRRRGRQPKTRRLELAENVWASATGDNGLSDYLDALNDCLQTAVNGKSRTALDLHYRDRASRKEIAEQLQLTAEGVKSLLRRARAALRECVERKVKNEE